MPATTCAFVTTSSGPHDPPRSLDAEPAGEAGDANDRRARRANGGDLQDRGIGRIDSGGGADDRGERVDALDRVHDRRGRQRLRERGDDARLLGEPRRLGLAGKVEERRADDPADREAGAQPERAAARGVEPAQRRQDRDQPPRRAADEHAGHLPEHPADRRAAERDERHVRARVADDLGREARADERPGHEPRERQRPGEEPAPEAADRGERDHGHRDPVGEVHPLKSARTSGPRHPCPGAPLQSRGARGRSSVG